MIRTILSNYDKYFCIKIGLHDLYVTGVACGDKTTENNHLTAVSLCSMELYSLLYHIFIFPACNLQAGFEHCGAFSS